MDSLLTELKKYGETKTNAPLKKHTTFKTGGPGNYLISADNTDKLIAVLNFLTGEGVPYFILGGGSNVLFSDRGFDGVVIKIATAGLVAAGDEITAEAGAALGAVVNLAAQNSLTGLEWATGIPGTVGGALRGNAGAMGDSMAESVAEAVIWRDGEVQTFNRGECDFGYRTSAFKTAGGVIINVKFILAKGDRTLIMKKTQEFLLHRQGKFPPYPSAGSFFKNIKLSDWPNGREILPAKYVERGMVPAGWLIEQCALKGYRVGDAAISMEHGNFIVNLGEAASEDILSVVEKAREEVYNRFGIELEPEVEIVK
jgi:UDP-N-acetylmuramate dehydrogenase